MEAAGVEPASGTQERRPFTRVSPDCFLPLPLPRRGRGRGAASLVFAHHPRGPDDGLSGLVGALTPTGRRSRGRTAA